MRIAVSGTQCIGKSTFVKDFIETWPMYSSPKEKYTAIKKVGNNKLKINEQGNEESQKAILDFLCDQVMKTKETDNVIFDRSVLDNLAYTLWLNAAGSVSDDFVRKTIEIVKSTLVFYDIIFFCPITKHSPINIEQAEHRSVDPVYREEIDNIFKALMQAYVEHSETYYPFKHDLGCPAIIEVFGNRAERVQLVKFYLNEKGEKFGEGESVLGDMSQMADAAELQRSLLPDIKLK